MPQTVRIAHPNYRHEGGADRVATAAARCLDAPVVTDRSRERSVPGDVEVEAVETGLARRIGDALPVPNELMTFLTWMNVAELHDADVVVGSGLPPGWYVPMDQQVTLQYIHATPRAQTDRLQESVTSLLGLAYALVGRIAYASRPAPDLYLANSELTARRLRIHWGVDEERVRVVYPPVAVDEYASTTEREPVTPDVPYYLTLSRLHHLKRIDEVIRAFQNTDRTLVVAGDGPDRDRLRGLGADHDNIRLVGRVSEPVKRSLLAHATALIMNTRGENFGIVPIEAMASGTSVLGVRDGFTQYQVIDGQNGRLYDRGVDRLRAAVEQFESEGVSWDTDRIEKFAERFSVERFEERLNDAVSGAVERAKISPGWERTVGQ